MEKKQLQKILSDISAVKIAVLGDFCCDAYWFIDEAMSEISVETNQATRPVRQQRYSLGGAGNVTNNLAAIGIKEIRAFGVIGTDPFGAEMKRIMTATGIDPTNLLVQEDEWYTHTYAKPYIDDFELGRVDFGNYNVLSQDTADRLIDSMVREIPKVDLVIINQQVPSGIHTEYFRKRLVDVIKQFPKKNFIVDSRNFNDFYDGAIRKMNDTEAARLCGLDKRPDEVVLYSEVVSSAMKLFEKFGKPLFVTRGSKGSLTIDSTGISEVPGLVIMSKVDTVGAGDSYLAGAAGALAAGYSMQEAAQLGALVAGVTVQKLFQCGTATPEEILHIGEHSDFIYHHELAEEIRMAKYLGESDIEIVDQSLMQKDICPKHAIFDHDGTISTLREGWEEIMNPMMIKAILGKSYKDADDALYHKVSVRVADFIDKTTGIQTLVQMQGLIALVREFGCVPENEILDIFGYKKIYNDELLLMVKEREKKLQQGELALDDFTLKNAVPFLMRLYQAGVKLYLASGTDEVDVKNEAKALGYDYLFEGRIYGAVGDINKEAKKIVLDKILDSIGTTESGQIITFGDGPVEIRETHKRNGITVGLASNEQRRYGLNAHKRTRLIKAGADIIISDFSQMEQLLGLMGIS